MNADCVRQIGRLQGRSLLCFLKAPAKLTPSASGVLAYRGYDVNNIDSQNFELPRIVPVMVLPETLLFPHALLPLLIFEPRYRAMLAWALEQQRMFCIALMKPGITDATSVEEFHHTAGLGLLRACVAHEDGTSHLILQGLARVRFTGFTQDGPFRLAEIEKLHSEPAGEDAGAALSAKVLQLCSQLRKGGLAIPDSFDEQLAQIDDPAVIADVVAHSFVRRATHRQEVMEELRVGERLRLVIRYLSAELA